MKQLSQVTIRRKIVLSVLIPAAVLVSASLYFQIQGNTALMLIAMSLNGLLMIWWLVYLGKQMRANQKPN